MYDTNIFVRIYELIIHINYYNILIITRTFCPKKMVNLHGHFVLRPKTLTTYYTIF